MEASDATNSFVRNHAGVSDQVRAAVPPARAGDRARSWIGIPRRDHRRPTAPSARHWGPRLAWRRPRHRPHRNPQRAPGANPASSAAAKGSGGASLFRPSAMRTISAPAKGSGGASLFRPSAMRTITRHSAPRAPRRSRCGIARPVTAPISCSTWAGGIRITCILHRYHAIECACGVRTAARPGVGVLSTVPGRSRDLLLSEACLVGPALATFIAALSVRYHVSRAKIREFLAVWFGVPLSVGTLDRCIREVGVACEPVVEDLLGDLRQAGVIHADETPWKQHGRLRWLWGVLSSTTAIFHIGSRQGDEIRDLIGDAFLGWLVSDGYGAYRKFKKGQRCLAHLIQEGPEMSGPSDPRRARDVWPI